MTETTTITDTLAIDGTLVIFLIQERGTPFRLFPTRKNFFRGGSQFALGTNFLVFPGKKRLLPENCFPPLRIFKFPWKESPEA